MPLDYGLHKFLHITGVVLFFGNLVVGPVWLMYAWFQEDRSHYGWAAKTLSDADMFLTVPGMQLTLWNGVFLAAGMGGIRQHPWLVESMVLLVLTSVLSVCVVLPWQERCVEAAQGEEPRAMVRSLVWWSVTGSAVMLPLTVVAWLMVTKQALFL